MKETDEGVTGSDGDGQVGALALVLQWLQVLDDMSHGRETSQDWYPTTVEFRRAVRELFCEQFGIKGSLKRRAMRNPAIHAIRKKFARCRKDLDDRLQKAITQNDIAELRELVENLRAACVEASAMLSPNELKAAPRRKRKPKENKDGLREWDEWWAKVAPKQKSQGHEAPPPIPLRRRQDNKE